MEEEAPHQWLNLALISLPLLFLLYKLFLHKNTTPNHHLPPSPPALPIIGHLHLVKEPLHRTLHHLSLEHGQVFSLRLGSRKTVVVSSLSAVEECFTEKDVAFANRPRLLSGKLLNYDYSTIGLCPYGDYWRNLRRFTAVEMFSARPLADYSPVRHKEVLSLVKQLFRDHGSLGDTKDREWLKVDMRRRLLDLTLNVMMRMIAGKSYFGRCQVSEEGKEFREITREFSELFVSAGYIGDFIPALWWADFQGVKKKMESVMKAADRFFQQLVDEHRGRRIESSSSSSSKGVGRTRSSRTTLIDRMLDLQEQNPEFYTNETVKGLVLVMLLAGADTTATTIEWAMILLLNHSEAMRRACDEIESKVGHDHLLEESDLAILNYLQNVISETMRLYPSAPLLLPHESTEDTTIGNFSVPRSTMLLVNAWSLHRDPELWVDAERFMPERFDCGQESNEGFKLIPFGAGRRACPGAVLGRRVVGLSLGALLQCFEWQRVGLEAINVTEGNGITAPPAEPLQALCKPREVMRPFLLLASGDDME
ncbi:cytochrome P450 81Q32-like [Rhodamnia argentea]|uniref:Cytochrome P450 81Q32-like n=1 Tax=Rhodamnia argentea TaxID=178133 RepID=A0A8B8PU49_9MYRT|nr:cytochrome P450 81Q32-like [Rhodamnia argentea]